MAISARSSSNVGVAVVEGARGGLGPVIWRKRGVAEGRLDTLKIPGGI